MSITENERGLLNTIAALPVPGSPQFVRDGAIIGMWRLGLNTLEIARKLAVREFIVANRLGKLRDAGAIL